MGGQPGNGKPLFAPHYFVVLVARLCLKDSAGVSREKLIKCRAVSGFYGLVRDLEELCWGSKYCPPPSTPQTSYPTLIGLIGIRPGQWGRKSKPKVLCSDTTLCSCWSAIGCIFTSVRLVAGAVFGKHSAMKMTNVRTSLALHRLMGSYLSSSSCLVPQHFRRTQKV